MEKWKTALLTAVLSLAMAAPALAQDGTMGDMNTMADKMDSQSTTDMMGKDGTGMTTMMDGVAYSALRKSAEALGYTVDWDGADMSVTLTIPAKQMGDDGMKADNGGMADQPMMSAKTPMTVFKIRMGSTTVQVSGASMMLEAAPYEKNGISYVPSSFVTVLAKYAM